MAEESPEQRQEVEARLPRTLYELSRSAGRTLDPVELVKLVAEEAGALLRGDAVAVYLLDEPTNALVPIFSNDSRPFDDRPLRSGEGAAGQAVERGELIVVDDYQQYDHKVSWGLQHNVRSVEAVPLMIGSRPIGALVIRFYDERPRSGEDESNMLRLLAAQASLALEAVRLYATSTSERERERALREITSALAENLDERNVLDLAVQYCAQLLQAPYARVWLVEPNGQLSCAAAHGYVGASTFVDKLASDSTSGLAAKQQIVNLANAPAEEGWRFNREFGERTGLGAYIGAGLWRAGESLGVIEVMRELGHRFNLNEERLLISLANAVAVAVSNARTHAAVEESARVLRSVYAAVGSGVLVIDPDGRVVLANAAAEAILGVPASRLVGNRPGLLDTEQLEDGTVRSIGELPAARAIRLRSEIRKLWVSFTHSDGKRRWLQLDAVPLFGVDGQITSVVSSFVDITEQRGSEEALRRRDAILEAVAFAAERLLSTTEWEQSIDDVLRQLGAATGVSRVYLVPGGDGATELGESSPHEWTAPGIGSRADVPSHGSYLRGLGLGRWEAVLRQGGIIEGTIHTFPEDEQVMLAARSVCSVVAMPIFAGNTWWGLIGFDDCVEEREWAPSAVEVLRTAAGTLGAAILRRRAEAERLQLVREQSARLEAEAAQRRLAFIADTSQILAASLDYESSLQALMEFLVPLLADGCFVDLIDGEGSTRRVASSVVDGIDVADSSAVVDEVIQSSKRVFSPRLLSVPLVTRAGVTGALTWIASSGRQAFDANDVDLAEHIGRRCALAIDNSRLYREARAAISLRDEFLSVAAHELKTPMTSLRGYAQLLARELHKGEIVNPERAGRAAQTIQVQSDKLTRLVAQLLDVSRLQSGKLAVEPRRSNVSELVREVVEAERTQLRDHTIVARLPGELWASIDPLRMEQVVTNLIDNAIKYSPDGGRIDVKLHCDELTGVLRLAVRDHGVGVPHEHREHIFDRFYQAHSGGALTSMAGMGLGLYISRQIVELHGGTIDAEFPDDGGTRLIVKLPLT